MNLELSTELASRLGWAVIHSLWQGALVAAILATALALLRRRAAAARHVACLLALAAMLAAFGATLLRSGAQLVPVASQRAAPASSNQSIAVDVRALTEYRDETRAPLAALETTPSAAQPAVAAAPAIEAWRDRLAAWAPQVGSMWIIGIALLSLWRIGGCWRVRSLRRTGVAAASSEAQRILSRVAERLGIRSFVRLLESSRAAVPMLAGFFRPVILLPARLVTGLTPRELEALLAHELAHLARGDLWTNLFLLCAETLFFYQPGVWWISARARREREHAADDLALRVCEGAVYATALTRLAELDSPPAPALAASGGRLLERIRRILGQPTRAEASTGLWASAVTLLSAALIFTQVLSANAADETKAMVVAAGESIQEAIDRAPAGAVIRVGAGEWKERIVISKPLTVEGAGWEKTRITIEEPPAENTAQAATELETRRRAATTREQQDQIDTEWIRRVRSPAIWVDRAQDVKLQKLRVQGLSQRNASDGGTSSVLVYFRKAKAAMSDCAVVGPFGNGIYLAGGSDVMISRSLVAALWGEGIYVAGRGRDELDLRSRLHLVDSEVRNVYHYGVAIARGCDDTVVERCRISGSAWHGIRYDDASPTITGNTIFSHARFGIYASGSTHATVSGNLLWKNEMEGMWCLYNNTDRIEGNTFVGNLRGGLAVSGGAKPEVTRNIFAKHPVAISCSRIASRAGTPGPLGDPLVNTNCFHDNAVVLQLGDEKKPAPEGSILVDPGFRNTANQDFALAADAPAKQANIGVPEPLPFASPWPLLAEEKAIIPDGNTRDSRSWTGPGEKKKAAAQNGAEKARSAEKAEIEVEWRGQWWPASVLEKQNDRTRIHYVGYGAEWDEWVPPERIRPLQVTLATEDKVRALVEKNRQAARLRAAEDRQHYSVEQLREIETLYQVANTKGKRTEEAKASLKQLLEKYDKANRTGCATLYLGQASEGADRIEYLTRAVEKFSDCYYFNGCQVGGYGRYVLALTLWEKGEKDKARSLFQELKTTYKETTDHRGRPMIELVEAAEKQLDSRQ